MNDRQIGIQTSHIVLLNSQHQVLLLKRANTGYQDGNYSLPAGHVDNNEYYYQTAIREAREEIAILIPKKSLQFFHFMKRHCNFEFKEKEYRNDIFYLVQDWRGDIRNNEPQKCSELLWWIIDDLPKNTVQYIKIALKLANNGFQYSEVLENLEGTFIMMKG